jgi:hypothetical protein
MTVQWPGQPVSTDKDLLAPTARFLRGLAVLENEPKDSNPEATAVSSNRAFAATPYSLQVITAGTLTFSKTASRFVAGLGGLSGIAAAFSGFFGGLNSGPQAALLGGAALVLASALLAIAIIVRSDVIARSTAQAAEYQARGQIAAMFLETTAKPIPPAAMPAATTLWIKRKGIDKWIEVSRWTPDLTNGVVAVLKDEQGTRVSIGDIEKASLGSS